MTDLPLSDNAHEQLIRMAAAAINGVDIDRFGSATEDEITDDIHPDLFADALQLESMDAHSAADISDALYEGLSLRYASRYSELMAEGLI